MTHGDGGKGDAQRPTDHKAFSNNYDTIDWSAKEVTCPNCGEKFILSSKHPHKHYCVLPADVGSN